MPLTIYNQPKIHWYAPDTEIEDVHRGVFAAIDTIEQSHSLRRLNNAKYLALYENQDSWIPGNQHALQNQLTNPKLTYNVIRSCIDTAASKIAAAKPRPEFTTDGGDYREQRQALALTQFNDQLFAKNQTYQLQQDAFVDAATWGTGVIQVYISGNQIKHERVRIDEILVDDYEGQYGKPQNYYHLRPIFRDHLLARAEAEQWDPLAIQAIKDAPQAETETGDSTIADMIYVAEAWHLPTRTKDGELVNGKHAVVLRNHTLQIDDYNYPKPPLVFYRWSPRRIGFYGTGLAETLVPIQWEIAQILRTIARGNRQTGTKIFVEPNSLVNPNQLANTNMPVIELIGGAIPQAVTFPAVAQETYQYLQQLKQAAYEETGISASQAHATRPSGVTANAALETLSDQQTERFMLNSQRFEQFSCDIAEVSLMFARELHLNTEIFQKPDTDRKLNKAIRWKDVDLDNIRIRCFPVSAFTQSPSARLQQIQDWMQTGAMPVHRAMQLMGDNPDYRDWVEQGTASLSRVQLYLSRMKHDNEYNNPDHFMDLDEALDETKAEINRSITSGVPEERIQLMRQFAAEISDLMNQAEQGNQPPAPPDAAPPGAPLANPEPPPTSALLPNAPPQ